MAYEELKTELEERLAGLQKRLASIKKDVTKAHSGDSAEQAQERENDEVIDAIGKAATATTGQVRAALKRIESGEYGVCSQCGEAISLARLRAVPESVSCLDCAAANPNPG